MTNMNEIAYPVRRLGRTLLLASVLTVTAAASCRPAGHNGDTAPSLTTSAPILAGTSWAAEAPPAPPRTGGPLHIALKATPAPLTARRRAELTIDISGGASPYANPFDPDQVAVDVAARGPGGRLLRVPAFWYEPSPDNSSGLPGWRVRINLPAPGEWQLEAIARDSSGTARSAPVRVRVANPDAPGFVRRATGAGRNRYFQFENGRTYFPVGENLCWSGQRGIQDYVDWFGALHRAGANYARLWMSARPIENRQHGAGRYDPANAAYFDRVLDLAERNGVYCMLAFGTYGELKSGGYFNEGKWPENPYSDANGGPVPAADPQAFFTNARAIKLYRQRLRYLIARYGAYSSVAFWEFWNESGGPRNWFAEMSRALAQTDPYRHPVTNSYSTTGQPEVWELPDLALTQTHRYGDEGSLADIADEIPGDVLAHDRYHKPHLMGEFGISWRGPDAKFDPAGNGINLHNGLWSSACSGAAGGAATWWWDNYVAPKNLYGTFTGLARFSATVDWANRAFEPLAVPPPEREVTNRATLPLGDAVFKPDGGWGVPPAPLLTLTPEGTLTGGPLPGYLYGPVKRDLARPLRLHVHLTHPATLTVRVAKVSDKSRLKVTRNGQSVADIPFNAAKDGPGGYRSTQFFPDYGIYQATFDRDVPIPLPTGDSTLTLENTEGDWLSLESLTVTGIIPPGRSTVRAIAIQESGKGETVLWLQDPQSNWRNARDNRPVAPQAGLWLTLPLPESGAGHAYSAIWWDTRTGKHVATNRATASGRRLRIAVPTFTRDIALHLTPAP